MEQIISNWDVTSHEILANEIPHFLLPIDFAINYGPAIGREHYSFV